MSRDSHSSQVMYLGASWAASRATIDDFDIVLTPLRRWVQGDADGVEAEVRLAPTNSFSPAPRAANPRRTAVEIFSAAVFALAKPADGGGRQSQHPTPSGDQPATPRGAAKGGDSGPRTPHKADSSQPACASPSAWSSATCSAAAATRASIARISRSRDRNCRTNCASA